MNPTMSSRHGRDELAAVVGVAAPRPRGDTAAGLVEQSLACNETPGVGLEPTTLRLTAECSAN